MAISKKESWLMGHLGIRASPAASDVFFGHGRSICQSLDRTRSAGSLLCSGWKVLVHEDGRSNDPLPLFVSASKTTGHNRRSYGIEMATNGLNYAVGMLVSPVKTKWTRKKKCIKMNVSQNECVATYSTCWHCSSSEGQTNSRIL